MTVESGCAVAIATPSDWLKNLAPVCQPMRSKAKTNRWHLVHVIFPAPWTSYKELLGSVIGSSRCFLLSWLVGVITLALFLRQSFEKRFDGNKIGNGRSMLTYVVVTMRSMILNRYLILVSFRKDLLGSYSKHNKDIYHCICIDNGDDSSHDYDGNNGDIESCCFLWLFRWLTRMLHPKVILITSPGLTQWGTWKHLKFRTETTFAQW